MPKMQPHQEGSTHHTPLYETSPLQVGVVGWGRGALRAEIGGGVSLPEQMMH